MTGATLIVFAVLFSAFGGSWADGEAEGWPRNLTTSTTTTTRQTIWIVTGPCRLTGRRHYCVKSPNWPDPFDSEGGECTLRIDGERADRLYFARTTYFDLNLPNGWGEDDEESSFTIETDSPIPQPMRAAELVRRRVTANDTILWSSQGWTNTSEGWVICADAVWYGSGRPNSGAWYSSTWAKVLLVLAVVGLGAACKGNKKEKKAEVSARHEDPPSTDVEAGVVATRVPEHQVVQGSEQARHEVVRVAPEQVQRV